MPKDVNTAHVSVASSHAMPTDDTTDHKADAKAIQKRAHQTSSQHLATTQRQIWADYAAQLMMESGQLNFAKAKKKAEKHLTHHGQLPTNAHDNMPSDEEIETALRQRQALFQPQQHLNQPLIHIAVLDGVIELMTALSAFSPYLTGAYWCGILDDKADIELMLFPESSKECEIALINLNIPFDFLPPQQTWKHAESALRLNLPIAQNVVVYIFPAHLQRFHLFKNDYRSRRGSLEQVILLRDHYLTTQNNPPQSLPSSPPSL